MIQVANLESFGKILPEVVRGCGLQSPAIAHHGFYRVGLVGPGKALRVRFETRYDRNSGLRHSEVRVDVQHLARFGLRFSVRGMGRVPFLPEEFQLK